MPEIDKENQQKGVKFQFRKRYRKVDWKLLASVDVDRISRELDYHALQANIMNVAFCDTKCQDFLDVDEDFIKLYRLGQYTIEYLLHCQEYLSHGAVELENKLREAIKFRNEVKVTLESKQKELTDVKKESRKRKKMISVYQGMLNQNGANGFHKCSHCEKAFVSAAFLASHLERRHGIAPTTTHSNEDKLRITNEELHTELTTLKHTLTSLESQLVESRGSRDQAEQLRDAALHQQMQQGEAHRAWEKEMKRRHEGQLEEIKAIYMKEATDALEGKRIAELALVEAKKGIVSNLGALRDDKLEDDELREAQLQQLEGRFETKLAQLQQELTDQTLKLRNQEDEHRNQIRELAENEKMLTKQLEDKITLEGRLRGMLETVEMENVQLQHLNKQKPDIRTTFSPAAQMKESVNVGTSNVEAVQTMLSTEPVTLLQQSSENARNVPQEKLYAPFSDKPFINTYYNHSAESLKNFRDEMKHELSKRTMNMTSYSEVESLPTKEYEHFKEQIVRNRVTNNTTLDIKKLEHQITEICTRSQASHCSPAESPRGSITANLPPKSPSFKLSRVDDDEEESRQQTPGYSLRDPNYNPLDEDSDPHPSEEEESISRSPSPRPVVKRRAPKSYSRDEDDSIFSFDGWSRMKNRNSMSADDAQQNIPLGHVAKMRQAVDDLNKQKRGEKACGVGVSVIPPPDSCPVGDNREEEDDFTISSLSERDVSPVGSMKVKVDIKRSSRNGVNDDGL